MDKSLDYFVYIFSAVFAPFGFSLPLFRLCGSVCTGFPEVYLYCFKMDAVGFEHLKSQCL